MAKASKQEVAQALEALKVISTTLPKVLNHGDATAVTIWKGLVTRANEALKKRTRDEAWVANAKTLGSSYANFLTGLKNDEAA